MRVFTLLTQRTQRTLTSKAPRLASQLLKFKAKDPVAILGDWPQTLHTLWDSRTKLTHFALKKVQLTDLVSDRHAYQDTPASPANVGK